DKIISFDQAVEKRSEVQPIAEESADFEDLGIQVEENYDVEEVVASVTGYVQNIVDEMDVEASIASTHNRRTINMQIDTN
ncbi:protein jag, partial [Streptococcus agalactiae]|nr:protein jag [Streptococcus agalactiae]